MPLTFLYPEALLLSLLLVVLYFRFMKHRNPWRTAAVIIVAVLLPWPVIQVHSKALDLFVLLDRSRSISDDGLAKQNELLELTGERMQPGDRVSVVTFKEKGYVEQVPSEAAPVREFHSPFSADASDLSDGLDTVLSMVSPKRQSRILLLSDGEYTGQDPVPQAQVARQVNVPVYVRDLKRQDVQNLFVSGVETDEKLLTNEPFRVLFRVNSTMDTPGRYRIYRDGKVAGSDRDQGWRAYDFRAGENRIAFTDSVGNTGIHGYKIEVETTPASAEKVLADNVAEKFVSVVGERPVLVVNNDGQPDNITSVLTAGGIPLHVIAIGSYRMGINELSGYKGVILNNVPVTGLQKSQIDDLARFVTQEGGGLLVAGGNRSFGSGGYYRTALEDVLPVSMEDRRQNKKLSGAFSFVLDRSGSMAMTVPSGQTKMAIADAAAIEALNLLGPADSISVIPVDSAAHIFVPQQAVEDPGKVASEIRRIESMGGGIFVYTGLVAAGSQVATAEQANKHILLFADAADAEEPGEYKDLLKKFKEAGITVSVVGLGTEKDVDAEFLKDVARLGGGQAYFTEDPGQLVQFFTADTIQYTRKNFIEEAVPVKILPGAFTMSPEQQWKDFTGAGYNLLFPRPNAEVALVTANGDNSPVLAFWQKGLGRSVALSLSASGSFSQNPDFPNIVLSAARWALGSDVNDSFQVESETDGNYARIHMEVSDEQRAAMGQAKLIMYAPDGSTVERPLQWESWNRLGAQVRLNEAGAWRGVIQMGDKAYRVGPVSMPVSPEFTYRGSAEKGRDTLLQLASITGGKELVDIKPLFERKNVTISEQPLITPLLIALLICLLGEIAEARFGWLQRLTAQLRGIPVVAQGAEGLAAAGRALQAKARPRKRAKTRTAPAEFGNAPAAAPAARIPAAAAPAKKPAEPAKPAAPEPTMDSFLNEAKERARRQTRR